MSKDWKRPPGQQQQRQDENPLQNADYGNYLDGNNCIKSQYVDRWADQLARTFGFQRLTKNQLRTFFGEVKRLQVMSRSTKRFDCVKPRLEKLKAAAHQRANRNSTIPVVFQEFINKNVDHVTNAKQLDAFVDHFEAVVAYCEGRL